MKLMKKIIALAISAAMTLSITTFTPVFAAGTQNGGALDFTGSPNLSGFTGIAWDSSSKVLTLDNFDYVSSADKGIVLPTESTIKVVGTNKIATTTVQDSKENIGIFCDGTLTIDGDRNASLTVKSETAFGEYDDTTRYAPVSSAIHLYGSHAKLTIKGGLTINATGGGCEKSNSHGISAVGAVTIPGNSKPVITIIDSTVNAVSGITKGGCTGLLSKFLTITNSTVTGESKGGSAGIQSDYMLAITNSTVTATSSHSENKDTTNFAIAGTFDAKNSTITATGGTLTNCFTNDDVIDEVNPDDSQLYDRAVTTGIYVNDNSKFTNCTVTATGGSVINSKNVDSTGIYALSAGNTTFEDCTVVATGGTATGEGSGSIGIDFVATKYTPDVTSDLTITGVSNITATANSASGRSFGVYCDGKISANITGGSVAFESSTAPLAAAAVWSDTSPLDWPSQMLSGLEVRPYPAFTNFFSLYKNGVLATDMNVSLSETAYQNVDKKITFESNDFDKLTNVEFFGKTLTVEKTDATSGLLKDGSTVVGTVEKGSIIVTLYGSFISTFSPGTNVITLNFSGGVSPLTRNVTIVPISNNRPPIAGGFAGSYFWSAPTTYKVTFNLYDDKTIVTNVESSALIKLPENPTREGYVFLGWYTDSGLTKLLSPDTRITADTQLYASWHKVGSEVTAPVAPTTPTTPTPTAPTDVPQTGDGWFKNLF